MDELFIKRQYTHIRSWVLYGHFSVVICLPIPIEENGVTPIFISLQDMGVRFFKGCQMDLLPLCKPIPTCVCIEETIDLNH